MSDYRQYSTSPASLTWPGQPASQPATQADGGVAIFGGASFRHLSGVGRRVLVRLLWGKGGHAPLHMSKNGLVEPTRTLGRGSARRAAGLCSRLLLRLPSSVRREAGMSARIAGQRIGMSWSACLLAGSRPRLARRCLVPVSQKWCTRSTVLYTPLCCTCRISLLPSSASSRPSRLTATCTPTTPTPHSLYIARLRNTRGSCDQLTPLGGAPSLRTGKSSARAAGRRTLRDHMSADLSTTLPSHRPHLVSALAPAAWPCNNLLACRTV